MGLLTIVDKPVYRTTDGREYADPEEAAREQVRVSLDEMMHDRNKFRANPGQGGSWTWTSVVNFISDNRETLRILLEGSQPLNANDSRRD